MKELEDTGAEPTGPQHDPARDARELFAFGAGGRLFAVYAEEADGVAEGLTPAPLPHAPAAVLGVVSVRGRVRTLLHTPALVAASGAQAATHGAAQSASHEDAHAREEHEDAHALEDAPTHAPRFVVALRGDEQLALAADSIEGVINVNLDSLSASDKREPPLAAALEHEGRLVQLLDTSRLFDAAMRGTERRRPRA
jgi:chemotaxis signal transduction protein